MTSEPTPIALPRYSDCFMCGDRNPIGLDLTFKFVPDRIEARFTPQARHAGYRDLVHSGILATMLDEYMGWSSIISHKVMCLASEMSVRYKRSARIGDPLRAYVELVADRHRLFEARGVVEREQDGVTLCTASGKYAPPCLLWTRTNWWRPTPAGRRPSSRLSGQIEQTRRRGIDGHGREAARNSPNPGGTSQILRACHP